MGVRIGHAPCKRASEHACNHESLERLVLAFQMLRTHGSKLFQTWCPTGDERAWGIMSSATTHSKPKFADYEKSRTVAAAQRQMCREFQYLAGRVDAAVGGGWPGGGGDAHN